MLQRFGSATGRRRNRPARRAATGPGSGTASAGAGCVSPAKISGSFAPRDRCAAMRPRPPLTPPDATNHSASASAASTAPSRRDARVPVARRRRARSVRRRCRARCGYRPARCARHAARRRNRRQSRIFPADRAVAPRERAQVPPASECDIVAFDARTARSGCCAALSDCRSASTRPSRSSPSINGAMARFATPRGSADWRARSDRSGRCRGVPRARRCRRPVPAKAVRRAGARAPRVRRPTASGATRRTPALDREARHDASRSEARMELRRVTQSEASSQATEAILDRAKRLPDFRAPRNARISSSPSVAS